MSYYPIHTIPDYYLIDDLLTDEHKLIRQSVREWVDSFVMPKIDDAAQHHKDIPDLMKELGKIGALGPYIPEEYGGAGLDQISYGLIMQELERGDSAVRSAASVQSSLVMFPINEFGSEEQKKKYLPQLASGEMIGAFGLTEPNHGSDPGSMETHFKDMGDHYLLNGAKMWITNAPLCNIAVVWAKGEDGKVRGLIVERGMEGFTTPETINKWSLRASKTGELVFRDVKIPKENILPKVIGLKGPLSCLNSARYGISWGVIGAAIDCYCTAVQYSKERIQFGKPIASYQLQQKKLAEFLTEITKAQLLCWRLGTLKNEHKATPAQISLAKRNNVKMAIDIARESRQILGGMGIMGEFPMMRHAANLESVITYEGTHDVHLLITGNDITGINAF
ncbi:TPA: acyl-CoA dehydrogenase family protein [Elizabethkingia anophelis]|uniref:acyl-CoA dehydrogenase family protein n=1 Tax=Elizabethkingia anophelis TaxID=1117645 RepID=UPI0016236216|nr:acyl-CoA dehydrogenase family protein [Elizabethkingia anophelis]MCT3673698.1 acyl-CoA dehydrogenase family protein [Elizabethkingia anophelis]MCT3681267.1 acyl-CoA dehydrogenase family protein [Elizabethkingia anophelis]MCT3701393.1 acyl-CoA dehydrogenase family protein [Elizabethkingia anophelis]MCT3770152.1 acyl-CoA dehydrogenase family protein [Elizabethkingia anophelis]MCT3780114.1 acyl-CoA dehydrogenase family protein [Elizabethkingia anophelis]